MEELFGLPAHPLLIHFPVVAIPTLTLLAIAMVVSSGFRDKYGKLIAGFGLVTAFATILAAQSGEALLETYTNKTRVEKHESLGETLRNLVLGLSVVVTGLVIVSRRSSATGRDPLSILLSVGVLVLSVLSVIWTIRTGHEGARLRWE